MKMMRTMMMIMIKIEDGGVVVLKVVKIMILTHCTLFYFQLSHVSEGTHICPRYEYKAFSFFFCFAIRAS